MKYETNSENNSFSHEHKYADEPHVHHLEIKLVEIFK